MPTIPSYTLGHLERLVDPASAADPRPHTVADVVHDLWLAIVGAYLYPTAEHRARLQATAERASAWSEEQTPGKGVSVDSILRWAERYEASRR